MNDGFEIIRKHLGEPDLERLRTEADRVQKAEGKACVRRLGSKSAVFRGLAADPLLIGLLPRPLSPVRSILFDKTPEENWPVAWHQDLTIAVTGRKDIPGYGPWSVKDGCVHVQPPASVLEGMWTLRIHLDDTSRDNGALHVITGSHGQGILDPSAVSSHTSDREHICECSAGDVLRISPLLLHSSSRSKSPSRRRVLHFEYADVSLLDPALRFAED